MFIHQSGNRLIFKRFPFHDVTPVAGRITDAQENRLIFCFGPVQGGLAPRIPVDRVVGVLQQVGAGFVNQVVGHSIPFKTVYRKYSRPAAIYKAFCRKMQGHFASN